MDEVLLDGKTYIASRKAAEVCGYTQDYVGQLSRKGLIDAKRVSGQWYIFLESLQAYKTNAEAYKPEPPKYQPDPSVEATIQVEGKEYVSAARAAKLTEYNQDYVGQLARAGKVPSRQIGTRWYVEREALLTHKKEKDAMLRAVQAESVGLKRPDAPHVAREAHAFTQIKQVQPLLQYQKEDRPLFPEIRETSGLKAIPSDEQADIPVPIKEESRIPIRVLRQMREESRVQSDIRISEKGSQENISRPGNTMFNKVFLTTTFAATLIVAVGLGAYKRDVIYRYFNGSNATQTASIGSASEEVGNFLEKVLTKELFYSRK